MKTSVHPGVLLLACLLLFSACAPGTSPGQTGDNTVFPSSGSASAPSALPETASSNGFTLEEAEEAFAARHADAAITVAKQEGEAYYIEGWAERMLYKMKFSVSDGEVLLDKTIQTAGTA